MKCLSARRDATNSTEEASITDACEHDGHQASPMCFGAAANPLRGGHYASASSTPGDFAVSRTSSSVNATR